MKLLHTSDWHIGKRLYSRSRYDEFAAFLDWTAQLVDKEAVDVLLMAGDVFDATTPGTQAQELYYDFLSRIAVSGCRHTVIVAGNHDSPSFLAAPQRLLKGFNIHIIGAAQTRPEDEMLVLEGRDPASRVIVCAVPYLRDRDLRQAEAGESATDKEAKIIAGIREHYAAVTAAALEKRAQLGLSSSTPDDVRGDAQDDSQDDRPGMLFTPIVALGHLFAAGGSVTEGDGMRDLYIGSLGQVPADVFPPEIDYLALGHLHSPQRINGREHMRYSGSPLQLGFGDAGKQKQMLLVEFAGAGAPRAAGADSPLPEEFAGAAPPQVKIISVEVPIFQRIERLRGSWEAIAERLRLLKEEGHSIWLEIVYEGREIMADLRERLEEEVADGNLEILCLKTRRNGEAGLYAAEQGENLDDLDVREVFSRRLEAEAVPEEQRPALRALYEECLRDMAEQEPEAV